MTHEEQEICLKENEWREVRDFIIGTGEYRMHLDKTLDGMQKLLVAIGGAILIPSIIMWVTVGMKIAQIDDNSKDIAIIQRLEMEAQGIRASNTARITALENRLK